MSTVYDFTVKDRKGGEVSLAEYSGKVLLIVNTAPLRAAGGDVPGPEGKRL